VNLATVQFHSRALGRHVTYTAILPEARHGDGPFPVLYQLHGRSDDHSAWVVRSRLVDHLAPYPLIAVLPDGGISGWRNAGPHEKYEDFVTEDLWRHVGATFRVRPGRAAVGGLSMGGGGSIRLGLKHPELYASVWAHSSALPNAAQMRERGVPEAEIAADDCHAAAERLLVAVPRPSLPRVTLDCGVEDALIEQNRAFHRHLQAIGFPHDYREHPGAHTWEYWDLHVREALRQHAEVLGIRRG
jgi:putative tributyrin esterase